jgi:hypothetical protein
LWWVTDYGHDLELIAASAMRASESLRAALLPDRKRAKISNRIRHTSLRRTESLYRISGGLNPGYFNWNQPSRSSPKFRCGSTLFDDGAGEANLTYVKIPATAGSLRLRAQVGCPDPAGPS